jgi:Antirestriction protein
MPKPQSTESTISTKIIPRGRWRSYEPYRRVADTSGVMPVDINTMNVLDMLTSDGGSATWNLIATPNDGFFLVPLTDIVRTLVSPSGLRVEASPEVAGIVATLYTLFDRTDLAAVKAVEALTQYASQRPDWAAIRSMWP